MQQQTMRRMTAWALATSATMATAADQSEPTARLTQIGDAMPVGPMAGVPALADLDRDGDLDVVIACGPCCGRDPDPDSGHVRVLLNDGSGRLRQHGERIVIGESALGVATGDVNGDGYPDAAVYQHSSYEAAVLLADGRGGLLRPRYVTLHEGSSPHVHSIALADVNHDADVDLLATLVDDHAVAVHLGDGRGGFEPSIGQPYFAFRHPYMNLNVVRMNGDRHSDLVFTDVRGCGLSVLLGSGTGMFSPSTGFRLTAHTPIESAERPIAAAVGDLDGDGDTDAVAIIDESPLAVVMINDGTGAFAEREDNPVRLAVPVTSLALADVSGDGVLDLIAGGTTVDAISVSLGRGDGSFAKAQRVEAGGTSPGVAVGDMNGDGLADVVTGNYDSGTVSVLLSTPTK